MSTLLFGLGQPGVTARLWNRSFNHNEPPQSFDESIGYPGCWDVRCTSDDEQSIGFQNAPAGPACVWFRKAGFTDQRWDGVLPDDGAKEIRLAKSLYGREHGFIRARGPEFIDEHDQPWPFFGFTIHTWLNTLILDGAEAFERMLDEPIELGYNTIVGHELHLAPYKTGWPQATRLDPSEHPDFYDKLGEGFDRAAARGLRIANGVFADLQFARPGFDARQHFQKSCDVMRGRWNVFARKGNEAGVNGWHEGDYTFPDMQGVLTSQGQAGIDTPPAKPFLQFVEYSPTRGWKWLLDSGGGMRQIHMGDTQWGKVDVPLINMEPQFFHDDPIDEVGDHRLSDPRQALELGIASMSNCEGLAFGASWAMVGRRLGPRARECAEQCMRGMRAGFVR